MGFAIVGLTGGIGSGKSTVARMFAELGVPIVDADYAARMVVEPGTAGLEAVVRAFGDSVLDADGRLDRAALGEVVFGDEDARKRLEGILHPLIAAWSMERLMTLAREGHPYAVYEAALLVENEAHRTMSTLIVVAVEEATQIERVRARDGLDEAAARARIASQLPLGDKIAVADYVVHNDDSLEDTRAAVVAIHDALLARFGEGP